MAKYEYLTAIEYGRKYGYTRAGVYQKKRRLILKYGPRGLLIEDSPANLIYFKKAKERRELVALIIASFENGESVGDIQRATELDVCVISGIVDGLIN